MANSQPQRTGSGREIAMLVGVLVLVAAGSFATYWTRSEDAEASGQPAATTPAPAPTQTPRTRTVSPAPITGEVVHADIYFDFKSTRLRAEAARLLQDKAAQMERTSTWMVLIQGYADIQGPVEYNRQLAQRRAETVKQFLVELGVPDTAIKVVTIGKEGALCDDPSRECQQLNRRVHLEIRKMVRASSLPLRPEIAVGDTLQTSQVTENGRP